MKIAIVLVLVAASAFAVQVTQRTPVAANSGFSLAEVQKMASLKESNMGRIILGLAELHLKGDAPIKRLINGLDDFVKELSQGIVNENSQFETKRAAHQSELQGLSSKIGEAKGEIAARQGRINNVLKPRVSQANTDISRDTDLIAEKKNSLAEASSSRATEHQGFLERVNEHNEAIAALDEALPLINSLKSSTPSLIQTRKASVSLKKVHTTIARMRFSEAALVEALISLATNQNFVNQEILDTLIAKFNDLRKKLADALSLEQANEAAAQKAFDEFVAQTNAELVELAANINKNTVIVTDSEREITDNEHVIDEKTFVISELQDNITQENENWRKETETHDGIIVEYNREISVVKEAQALFQNAHFSEYVVGKLSN